MVPLQPVMQSTGDTPIDARMQDLQEFCTGNTVCTKVRAQRVDFSLRSTMQEAHQTLLKGRCF